MDLNLQVSNSNDTWNDIDIGFTSDNYVYDIKISNYNLVRIKPTAIAEGTTIEINGETSSVDDYKEITLVSDGTTTVLIDTTSEDEKTHSRYVLNFIKTVSGLSLIEINGLEHKVSFIPITSNYYYKYVINSEEDLPRVSISAIIDSSETSWGAFVFINRGESPVSTDVLTEGENIIEIKIGPGLNNYELFYSITIDVVIDNLFVEDIHLGDRIYPIYNIDKVFKYCTVEIDTTNSDPATCCTYVDDAKIFQPAINSDGSINKEFFDKWDTFFGHYPVLFKEGKEIVRINPNDFSKDIFGNNISASDGDIMIKFPRRGININYKDANTLLVSMTDNPNDFRYTYYAHNVGDVQRDAFYLGAYKLSLYGTGTNESDGTYVNTAKGRSISNKQVEIGRISQDNIRNIPNGIFKYYCENNNDNNIPEYIPQEGSATQKDNIVKYNNIIWKCIEDTYDIPSQSSKDWELLSGQYGLENIFQRIYIQVIYILKYKNLDSQSIIGAGIVNPSDTDNFYKSSNVNITGSTDEYGMDSELVNITNYKNSTASQPSSGYNIKDYHVKLFGVEDIWGYRFECLDEAYTDQGPHSVNQGPDEQGKSNTYLSLDGEKYINVSKIDNVSGFIVNPLGYSHFAFIPKSVTNDIQNSSFKDNSILNGVVEGNIDSTSGILRMMPTISKTSNSDTRPQNFTGIFNIDYNHVISNYSINTSNTTLNWFKEKPRFKINMYASSRTATNTLSEEPSDWDSSWVLQSGVYYNTKYYFTCYASSVSTARLMYL